MPFGHGKQRGAVFRAGRVHKRGRTVLPLKRGANDGVIAVQKDVVEKDALLFLALRGLESSIVIGAGAAVEVGVAVGIAPAQVSEQGFAGDVMGKQAAPADFDKRQIAQPSEQSGRVPLGVQFRQQRLGRQMHERAGLERGAVRRIRDVLNQPFEQSLHDVLGAVRVEMQAASPGEHIGD